MRISGNFNIPKVNFTAIHVTEEAAPIVEEYMGKSDSFETAYKRLEATSNEHDEDIYIQKATKGGGLNFQLLDPYTRETKCYLAADPDPDKSAKAAVVRYNEFLTTPQPPRQALPKREDEPASQKKWRFLGIFGAK